MVLGRVWAAVGPRLKRKAETKEKQEKDLALYCARSLTTARSAGSLRELD